MQLDSGDGIHGLFRLESKHSPKKHIYILTWVDGIFTWVDMRHKHLK